MRVGVFDSGIGGITVLHELRRAIPDADFVYLGDTAHVPYGTKSPTQIERLSGDCARTLRARGVDAVVVACNTASSWALDAVRDVMGRVPVLGVVEPGVLSAIRALEGVPRPATMLVLATRATVRSGYYGRLLRRALEGKSVSVIEQACPLLVPMIEEGWVDHPILKQTVAEYVSAYAHIGKSGVALLGCTHYPWIHRAFEEALPGWKVVNSAHAVAEALSASDGGPRARAKPGKVEWIFTDPEAVPKFALHLIQEEE